MAIMYRGDRETFFIYRSGADNNRVGKQSENVGLILVIVIMDTTTFYIFPNS